MAPFVFYAGLFTGGEMGAAAMRVLGYFIGCCPAVLLLSVIIEKRNAEVEITYEVEIPHAQDELRPRVAAARVRMFSCILRLG